MAYGRMMQNEFKCLSNAVFQRAFTDHVEAPEAIPGMVRGIVEENKLDVTQVYQVVLTERPLTGPLVECELALTLENGDKYAVKFQRGAHDPRPRTSVVYDRERDGACEYLHLKM